MVRKALAHVGRQWMGALALFVVLGGGVAYAAATVGSPDVIDNSLQSADLKDGAAVKSIDVGDGALTGVDVKNGGLTGDDLGAGSVNGNRLANGSVPIGKLGSAPAAVVQNLSYETTQTATGTTLHATDELFDTAALHDNATNTESFRAPVSGTYLVTAIVDWEASNAGYRRIYVVGPNGNFATVSGPALPSPGITTQTATGIEQLDQGETVHTEVVQGSGGELDAKLARFEIAFVGR